MDLHTTLNTELTRTGQYYPPEKLSAVSVLQEQSRNNAPFSIATLPYSHTRWGFKYPSLRDATLQINTEPVPIRLACVLNSRIQYPHRLPWFVDVMPLYEADALKSNGIMVDHTGFHPSLDLGWYSDRVYHPIRIQIRRREVAVPGRYYITPLPKYDIDVFDNTDLQFADNTRIVHPRFLKARDLVLMTCHMQLDADPAGGAPSMYLVAQEIRLVHLASEPNPL